MYYRYKVLNRFKQPYGYYFQMWTWLYRFNGGSGTVPFIAMKTPGDLGSISVASFDPSVNGSYRSSYMMDQSWNKCSKVCFYQHLLA